MYLCLAHGGQVCLFLALARKKNFALVSSAGDDNCSWCAFRLSRRKKNCRRLNAVGQVFFGHVVTHIVPGTLCVSHFSPPVPGWCATRVVVQLWCSAFFCFLFSIRGFLPVLDVCFRAVFCILYLRIILLYWYQVCPSDDDTLFEWSWTH